MKLLLLRNALPSSTKDVRRKIRKRRQGNLPSTVTLLVLCYLSSWTTVSFAFAYVNLHHYLSLSTQRQKTAITISKSSTTATKTKRTTPTPTATPTTTTATAPCDVSFYCGILESTDSSLFVSFSLSLSPKDLHFWTQDVYHNVLVPHVFPHVSTLHSHAVTASSLLSDEIQEILPDEIKQATAIAHEHARHFQIFVLPDLLLILQEQQNTNDWFSTKHVFLFQQLSWALEQYGVLLKEKEQQLFLRGFDYSIDVPTCSSRLLFFTLLFQKHCIPWQSQFQFIIMR